MINQLFQTDNKIFNYFFFDTHYFHIFILRLLIIAPSNCTAFYVHDIYISHGVQCAMCKAPSGFVSYCIIPQFTQLLVERVYNWICSIRTIVPLYHSLMQLVRLLLRSWVWIMCLVGVVLLHGRCWRANVRLLLLKSSELGSTIGYHRKVSKRWFSG